ncbi:DNA-directed RNA polymerase subunit beta [Paenibacillus sp. LHD-117]|uniref:DNA-directed RNA polymerase subunit beta n=1 Tax=Paenibacillus sp. LHD-117 TaxID=3071412 RepID=UPI0027DF3112|nr:DNA-directed RNA polymerase subunit beta [Paenibacillus sp. LHD-117]MDQ6420927.1 DNA-directed RNA polymerase subunit beta [Paenibacillus sp. LHD-117]
MADERRDLGRTEFDSVPASGGVRAGGATAELRTSGSGSGLSRMERHGSSQSQATSVKTVPAKTAKLKFDKQHEEPEEPVKSSDAEGMDEDGDEERTYPKWARVSFWLFRKSIVPVVMVVMLVVGLYVGYVFLGKQSKDEVLDWSTWKHLYDLVFAES